MQKKKLILDILKEQNQALQIVRHQFKLRKWKTLMYGKEPFISIIENVTNFTI